MREISEYVFIGNYLLEFSQKYGQDSIKYETVKLLNEKVLERVNKNTQNYQIQKIDDKMSIVKKMISKGVFRTEPSNKTAPFKQVYNYEIFQSIYVYYSCDGNLVFKFAKEPDEAKAQQLLMSIKRSYSDNLNLDIKNAITSVLSEYKQKQKTSKSK